MLPQHMPTFAPFQGHLRSLQQLTHTIRLRNSTYESAASNTYCSTPILSPTKVSLHPSSSTLPSAVNSSHEPILPCQIHPQDLIQPEPQAVQGEEIVPAFTSPEGVTTTAGVPNHSSPSHDEEFARMCANYLNMLSQDESDMAEGRAPLTVAAQPLDATDASDRASVTDVGGGSDSLSPRSQLGDLSISPFDSPFEDGLVTPALDFEDATPVVVSSSPLGLGLSLFEDMGMHFSPPNHLKDDSNSPTFEGLMSMPSPTSSTTTLQTHCSEPFESTPPTLSMNFRRRYTSVPTGTRPGMTPDTLIAIDAPTKPRRYSGPSTTAKKDKPKYIEKRKRGRSMVSEEEAHLRDEQEREPKRGRVSDPANLELALTEAALIEVKRRQNTEAARRSRRRKLEYQQGLEARIDALERDLDSWKTRAVMAEVVLRHHGLQVPDLPTQ